MCEGAKPAGIALEDCTGWKKSHSVQSAHAVLSMLACTSEPRPGESQELSREVALPLTSAGSMTQLTEVYNPPQLSLRLGVCFGVQKAKERAKHWPCRCCSG